VVGCLSSEVLIDRDLPPGVVVGVGDEMDVDLALDRSSFGDVLPAERVRRGAPGCLVFVGVIFDSRGLVPEFARTTHDELGFGQAWENVAVGVVDPIARDKRSEKSRADKGEKDCRCGVVWSR